MKYANQNQVVVKRSIPDKGTKQPYICIYTKNIETAARTLGGVAFKLYLYIASNSNDYTFDYSPQHFSEVYGVSLQRARDAFKELIKEGYLIETDSHRYEFSETPRIEEKFELVQERRMFLTAERDENGKSIKKMRPLTYQQLLSMCGGDKDLTNLNWMTAEKEP